MKILNYLLLSLTCFVLAECTPASEPAILVSKDATPLERLAAKEIRRYVYLRTNELLDIIHEKDHTGPIIELEVDDHLGPQEFDLKTEPKDHLKRLKISGGSAQAVLFAAYEFAEQIGVRFYLHGDVVPDQKIAFEIPDLDIHEKPVFDLRGIQPFHDFPEGPDWWNEHDYKAIIAQLAKMKMNFIGFHTYPERTDFNGGGYKAEPLVWIGKEQDVNEDGTVNAAYPALHFHTMDSTWGYSSMPTSDFSQGASQLFETDWYGADYMKGISSWPHSEAENIELFNKAGSVFKEAFSFANVLGIKTSVGTETYVTIPQKMKERYGIQMENDEVIKEIYKGIFARITKTYPLDYYWLWTPESWTWQGTTEEEVRKTEKDILLAHEALKEMGMPFTLATCGWVLGPPRDRARFDRVLPKDIAFSCINRGVGYSSLEPGFKDVNERSKWAIPWMEDDPDMISAQLWVGRLRKDALDAYRYGCDGLLGIHWRTRILGPNVSALAKAAWSCDEWQDSTELTSRDLPAKDFYMDWVQTQFGVADEKLAGLLVKLDSKGYESQEGHKGDAPLNASSWIGGPGGLMVGGTSPERIDRYDFIDEFESYKAQIHGAGNLERFDYWLNSFKFNKAILEAALTYQELDSLMEHVENPANHTAEVKDAVLKKRLELTGKWKRMITILLAKLSSNGELGNLANLEMHSNKKLGYLSGFDSKIEALLEKPLPSNAYLSKTYEGEDRVLVFTNPSVLMAEDEFNIRIRVLSNEKDIRGKFFWRNIGADAYQEIELDHMARNVFEVDAPMSVFGDDFEYFIEIQTGENILTYPATARDINCSVVVF